MALTCIISNLINFSLYQGLNQGPSDHETDDDIPMCHLNKKKLLRALNCIFFSMAIIANLYYSDLKQLLARKSNDRLSSGYCNFGQE